MTIPKLAALAVALATVAPTNAAIIFSGSPETSAPPATLGPYAVTPFPPDARPRTTFTNCGIFGCTTNQAPLLNNVPSPLGGAIGFSSPLDHLRVGPLPEGWGGWTHGYNGDVYFQNGNTLTIDMPGGSAPATRAFYFYLEPNLQGTFLVTATAQDGTTSGPVSVRGCGSNCGPGGAKYFGFYATEGDTLANVSVSVASAAGGFAVGEFGIFQVPEAASLVLMTAGCLAMMLRRQRD